MKAANSVSWRQRACSRTNYVVLRILAVYGPVRARIIRTTYSGYLLNESDYYDYCLFSFNWEFSGTSFLFAREQKNTVTLGGPVITRRSISCLYLSISCSFIIIYWNCDGSLRGHWCGNWFVARVGENWQTPSSFYALAFHSGWKDRNVDCCINTAVNPPMSDTKFVNFGLVKPES